MHTHDTQQDTPDTDDRLLRKAAVRKVIPASDTTFWRWEKAGILVPVRIGNALFYKNSHVQKLVARGWKKSG